MQEEIMQRILQQLLELKSSTMTQKRLLELTKKAVLDTNDVAHLFNRKTQTIHVWRRKKEIYGKKINGRWFYSWDTIAELLDIKPN